MAAVVYYFAYFDTSVEVPEAVFMGRSFGGGRVNNLGLMQERQNGLMLGTVGAVVGLALLVYSERRSR